MQNVEQAVEALGAAMGLDGIGLDGAGNLTLIFDGSLPLNIARRGASELELWTTLPGQGTDAASLRRLLEANHLGEATGAARLALQPDGGAAVLCERLDVRDLDAEALARRVLDFVRHASFWRSDEATHGAASLSMPTDDFQMGSTIFRA